MNAAPWRSWCIDHRSPITDHRQGLAGTLGAGSAVAQNSPEARPQTQARPQPRAVGSDEEYANLYTHTVGNIRSAMLGGEAARQPGAGHLIRNPDPHAFQPINIGRLAERDDIEGGAVRGLFRRSDNYLLGFYVRHGDRQIVYTFTEGGSDMIPGEVYPEARRSRFPFPVTYRHLPGIQVGRGRLRDAVRRLFDNDPGTSNHNVQDGVERLAVALAEGARFQVIPGLIAQHIRGGQDWTAGRTGQRAPTRRRSMTGTIGPRSSWARTPPTRPAATAPCGGSSARTVGTAPTCC
ncbi:hypothetical protein GCM10010211_08460 [Streptomyces albospinus]|uniref:Uncharacterized protein n=1 Tax=Streptomyces albospinus TaxID=285515 RepID=A0ABQ2UP27_9ACTN|nr:ribosome-inactivating family protein [Streptomyces albospinus]GGU47036.1 hypothetical protein GCM10010211_08460 [Streptomyces albospinus]